MLPLFFSAGVVVLTLRILKDIACPIKKNLLVYATIKKAHSPRFKKISKKGKYAF